MDIAGLRACTTHCLKAYDLACVLGNHTVMNNRITRIIPLLICLAARPCAAQKGSWLMEERGYYDPILAEPRAAQTEVLFPARAASFPFAVNDRQGTVWDISVGHEFPIVGFETNKSANSPTGVPAGKFGVGLWFPLSFHMIEDMGKDPSNPILDTDYRFSGLVKAQWGLRDNAAWWSSAHVGAKFQFGHESTHLGDEFTLNALHTHFADFLRVNVSYEYYDAGASFEPNVGKYGRHQIKLRGGDIWLWRPDQGWYDRELLQPFGRFIAGSKRNHEPYVQAEWYRQPDGASRLGYIVSADVRDRTIYQYAPAPDATRTNPSEPTEWSTNLMAGVRQVRSGPGVLGKITPTYYARAYYGVNPSGQFRSQSGFYVFGVGVQFGF